MTKIECSSIDSDSLRTICHHLGYGNPKAKTWFLGIEEGGGSAEQLGIRAEWDPVMDCKKAHASLGIDKFHRGIASKLQSTWNGMCRVMLGEDHTRNTRENRRLYQSERLGRSGDETFLTELYPIPKPHVGGWPDYAGALGWLSPEEYRREQLEPRLALLRAAIIKFRPRLIIAYGKGQWDKYALLASAAAWETQLPFKIGTTPTTKFVLTPHFVAREMNHEWTRLHRLVAEVVPQSTSKGDVAN